MPPETDNEALNHPNNPKKTLIRIGIFMAVFALLCLIFTWLGFGRMVFVALLSGLLVTVMTVISMVAPRVLGPYESDQVRKFCFSTAPLGIVMLGVLSQMYPSSFTPDLFAPYVSIAKLDENIERYEGHKIRVEGKVYHVEWGGWGYDENDREVQRVELWMGDDEENVFVLASFEDEQGMPVKGSTVSLIGIVQRNVVSDGRYLSAHRMRIIDQAEALAVAD